MLVKQGTSPIHMLGRISEMVLFVQNTHERCRKENIGRHSVISWRCQHASEPGSSVASSSIFFQLCQATIFKIVGVQKKFKKAWSSCAFLKLLVKTNKEMSKLRSTGLCEKKIKCLKKGPSQAVEAVENTCFGSLFCFFLFSLGKQHSKQSPPSTVRVN